MAYYRLPKRDKGYQIASRIKQIPDISAKVDHKKSDMQYLALHIPDYQTDRIPDHIKLGKYRHDYEAWSFLPAGKYENIEYKVMRKGKRGKRKGTSEIKIRGTFPVYTGHGRVSVPIEDTYRFNRQTPDDKDQLEEMITERIDEESQYVVDDYRRENPEAFPDHNV